MQRPHSFCSKLLLFGEYSILLDSSALSIPYSHFQAELSFIRDDKYTDLDQALVSNQSLKEFAVFLNTVWKQAGDVLNLTRLNEEIKEGLYLESTIPQGYGLGSSGALVAAIYERIAFSPVRRHNGISSNDINLLREILSRMESFFHGKSSGIDPLAIYLKAPLFISREGNAEIVGIPRQWNSLTSGIFLVNTGAPGKTNSLVPAFLEKFAPGGIITDKGKELCRLNNNCIRHLLSGEIASFWKHLNELSAFQLNNLSSIIPLSMHHFWQSGLESSRFLLKICGSGGGGFLIGFAEDYQQAQAYLKEQGIQTIPVYLSG